MSRKNSAILIVLIVLITAAVVSARWFHGRNDSTLQGSGTVEARDIRVGSKVGGRIDKVLVREGDYVKAGQILITFDDKELQAALGQSRAA
jgi:multidrug resistance efflux pump